MTGPERQSVVPAFKNFAVTWQCWIVDEGQAYEWRSTCNQYRVRRNERVFVAMREARIIGKHYPTIRAAMDAAQGVTR